MEYFPSSRTSRYASILVQHAISEHRFSFATDPAQRWLFVAGGA